MPEEGGLEVTPLEELFGKPTYGEGKDFFAVMRWSAMQVCDTEADAWLLLSILMGPWPRSTSQIADSVSYKYSSITHGLGRLVKQGLVQRVRQGQYRPTRLALKEIFDWCGVLGEFKE